MVGGTRAQILDVAERLVQTRGFNDFSYADVASELAVTNAALHYHFRTKALLGDALIERYAGRFFAALDRIEATTTDRADRLREYVGLYRDVLEAERMCLCGVLAAEYQTLPEGMQSLVLRFFERNEAWVARILVEGADEDQLRAVGSAIETAQMIVDALEGAVMISRARHDVERFSSVAERLLAIVAL